MSIRTTRPLFDDRSQHTRGEAPFLRGFFAQTFDPVWISTVTNDEKSRQNDLKPVFLNLFNYGAFQVEYLNILTIKYLIYINILFICASTTLIAFLLKYI